MVKARLALPEASEHCIPTAMADNPASGRMAPTPTSWDRNAGVRIADRDKAVLQEQPLVIIGAVADEHLLVLPTA